MSKDKPLRRPVRNFLNARLPRNEVDIRRWCHRDHRLFTFDPQTKRVANERRRRRPIDVRYVMHGIYWGVSNIYVTAAGGARVTVIKGIHGDFIIVSGILL